MKKIYASVGVALVSAAAQSQAAVVYNNGGTSNWSTVAKWFTDATYLTPAAAAPGNTVAVLPANEDKAIFNSAATFITTVDTDRYLKDIEVQTTGNSSFTGGTLYLTGGGLLSRSATQNSTATTVTGLQVNSNIVLLGDYSFANEISNRYLRFGQANTPTIVAGASNATLTLQGASTGLTNYVQSSLQDGGAGGILSLAKAGAGYWLLQGTNSYSGTTTVSAGTLAIATRNALYAGNTANWTDTKITVASTGTLSLNVGGASDITAADIGSIFALGSATGGLQTGATVNIDTTLGGFSYAAAIANSNGGANAFRLAKSGVNTLTLSGNSSFSGGTTIASNGGNLRIESGNALGVGDVTILTPSSGATSGTLQLANGISTGFNVLRLSSGVARSAVLPHVENVSGNNTITGYIETSVTSTTFIKSTSGKLTLAGNYANPSSTGASGSVRNLSLYGDGDGEISGRVFNGNGTRFVGLVKDGTGTWSLTNPGLTTTRNDFDGAMTVNGGTLLINTDNSLSVGAVTVNSGGILGGSGKIGASGSTSPVIAGGTTIKAGGTLSPGNSAGVLSFNSDMTLETGSTLKWELTANADSGRGSSHDGIDFVGTRGLTVQAGASAGLVFNSVGSTVDWTDGFWGSNHQWLVFSNASTLTLASLGVFDTLSISSDSLGQSFSTTGGALAFSTTGNDVYLNYAVPEPTSMTLIGLGAIGLLRRRVRSGKA